MVNGEAAGSDVSRTYRHFIPGSDQHAADLMDRLLGA
jgi:hypothetical protein